MKKIALVLFGLFILVGAGVVSAEKIFHFGTGGEPGTLDPHKASGVWENDIISEMILGLMTEDPASNVVYGSAKSHTVSKDGTVYTFKLRKNKWSDGTPVTAHDFEYAFKRILNPDFHSEYASMLYPIKNAEAVKKGELGLDQLGAKALDDDTFQLTLENPTPYILAILKHYTSFPVPKHLVEKLGDDWLKPGNMVGNNAYVLKEWVPTTHVLVEKNPYFYDAKNVKIDKIYFYPTEDRNTALKRFRAGELHLNTDFPVDQINWIRKNLEGEYDIGPYVGIYYYTINTKVPKLADKNIRLALSMAINREVIVDKILRTGEKPAYSFVPPLSGFEMREAKFKQYSYKDAVARAKKIMAAAGYSKSKPLEVQLRYNTSENHKKVAVAVSAMWKAIYVETELYNSDVAVHYDDLEKHNFEIGRAGWISDYPDPHNFLTLWTIGDGHNYSQYDNGGFTQLVKLSAEQSGRKRALTLARAEEILLEDLPIIPIYYYVYKNLVSKKVIGYVGNSEDIHRVRYMDLKP